MLLVSIYFGNLTASSVKMLNVMLKTPEPCQPVTPHLLGTYFREMLTHIHKKKLVNMLMVCERKISKYINK